MFSYHASRERNNSIGEQRTTFHAWAKVDELPLFTFTEPVGMLSAALVPEIGLEDEDDEQRVKSTGAALSRASGRVW